MCSRKFPFYILKEITMKNFTKALAALAALSVVGTSAFAQTTLKVEGNVKAATCALSAYLASAPTVAVLSIPMPDITPGVLGLAVGAIKTTAYTTAFLVKPTSTTCLSSGPLGSFNVNFSTATLDANVNTRAANTGTATGVTTDLIQTASIGTGAGLTIPTTPTTGALQHALANQAIATGTGLAFTARYYKTTTAPAVAGTVTTTYTLNNEYF
jgi:hypothetical protein